MAIAEATETYLTPANIARSLQLDPSAPVRWLRKGVLLADGSRLRLQHVCVPGGYRVKQEWLDAFLQALADDRAGRVNPAPKAPRQSARIAAMRSELAEQGFQVAK